MHILIATRNPSKAALFTPLLAEYGFEVGSLVGLPEADREAETGTTPAENALAKARQWHSADHPWTFGDDSGLEVDALGGEPGVQVRRWGGRFTDTVPDEVWLEYLLERLRGVPPERRTARWVAAWACVAPDGSEHVHTSAWPFRIAERPVRPMLPGWPMSAVRIGTGEDMPARHRDVGGELRAWGVLDRLVERFAAR